MKFYDCSSGVKDDDSLYRFSFEDETCKYIKEADIKRSNFSSDGSLSVGCEDKRIVIIDNNSNKVTRLPLELSEHQHTNLISNSGDLIIGVDTESIKCWRMGTPLNDYKRSLSDYEKTYFLWLLAQYKDFTKESYPNVKAIRIEDVVNFSKKINPGKTLTVDNLATTFKQISPVIRCRLGEHYRLYACLDQDMDKAIQLYRAKQNK